MPSRNLGSNTWSRNSWEGHLVPPTNVTWGWKGTLAAGWRLEKLVIISPNSVRALSVGDGSNQRDIEKLLSSPSVVVDVVELVLTEAVSAVTPDDDNEEGLGLFPNDNGRRMKGCDDCDLDVECDLDDPLSAIVVAKAAPLLLLLPPLLRLPPETKTMVIM